MARITGPNGERTAAAIRHAALRLIHQHGFAALSLRDLPAEVGIRPGSLYSHITPKQGLLEEGVSAGVLAMRDMRVAAYATPAMPTGVRTWYRPLGAAGSGGWIGRRSSRGTANPRSMA